MTSIHGAVRVPSKLEIHAAFHLSISPQHRFRTDCYHTVRVRCTLLLTGALLPSGACHNFSSLSSGARTGRVSSVLSSLPYFGHPPYARLLASAQPIISQVVAGTDSNYAVQITVRDVAGALAADVADLRLVWANGTAIWEGKEYGDRWQLSPGVTITLCHGGGSLILERLCDIVVESLRFGPFVSFNLLWQPPDRAPTRDIVSNLDQ
ncbi:unnamed protein product [Closterium sp. NIES-54]